MLDVVISTHQNVHFLMAPLLPSPPSPLPTQLAYRSYQQHCVAIKPCVAPGEKSVFGV
jgi:hypothetical protein